MVLFRRRERIFQLRFSMRAQPATAAGVVTGADDDRNGWKSDPAATEIIEGIGQRFKGQVKQTI